MTPENFCYFLQGFLEISDPRVLDERETQMVKDHLNLVFTKVTPDRPKNEAVMHITCSNWVPDRCDVSDRDVASTRV